MAYVAIACLIVLTILFLICMFLTRKMPKNKLGRRAFMLADLRNDGTAVPGRDFVVNIPIIPIKPQRARAKRWSKASSSEAKRFGRERSDSQDSISSYKSGTSSGRTSRPSSVGSFEEVSLSPTKRFSFEKHRQSPSNRPAHRSPLAVEWSEFGLGDDEALGRPSAKLYRESQHDESSRDDKKVFNLMTTVTRFSNQHVVDVDKITVLEESGFLQSTSFEANSTIDETNALGTLKSLIANVDKADSVKPRSFVQQPFLGSQLRPGTISNADIKTLTSLTLPPPPAPTASVQSSSSSTSLSVPPYTKSRYQLFFEPTLSPFPALPFMPPMTPPEFLGARGPLSLQGAADEESPLPPPKDC
ncbi:hypothetical protein HDU97_003677 [Phlyctochytrium planicorne]|nr:hypothetical protein HDU97_003677 [Phlyctochytrium planicorne]